LIYLDAGYSYAYYDRSRGDLNIDLVELQKKLEQLLRPAKRATHALIRITRLSETNFDWLRLLAQPMANKVRDLAVWTESEARCANWPTRCSRSSSSVYRNRSSVSESPLRFRNDLKCFEMFLQVGQDSDPI